MAGMGLMRGLKDSALGLAARTWLNSHYLQGIGTITALSVDTARRHVDAEIVLRGEERPVRVSLAYALVKSGRVTKVSLRSFESSRAWLSEAARRFVVEPGLAVPLPQLVAHAVERAGH